MPTELQPADVLHRSPAQRGKGHRAIGAPLVLGQEGIDGWGIDPIVAEVIEERVEALEINARSVVETVVERAAKPTAIAEVFIIAQVISACERRSGFNIVDAAPVPVVGSADKHAEFAIGKESLAQCAVELVNRPPTDDVGMAAASFQVHRGP